MDYWTSFRICSAGLEAQRARMDVVTGNIANAGTTQTAEGGPYRRKTAVLASEPAGDGFRRSFRDALSLVRVSDIVEDPERGRLVHDPSHPHANEDGYVAMPNVNIMTELVEMMMAGRSFEACVTAFDASKNMALKTLEIGK